MTIREIEAAQLRLVRDVLADEVAAPPPGKYWDRAQDVEWAKALLAVLDKSATA